MPLTYQQSGVDYTALDDVKRAALAAAKVTGKNILGRNQYEIADTRGESAYVWKQGSIYLASVMEGLGTKNLVADAMREITGKTYYDIVAHDTVACIINDLVSVGAKPLTLHAYWCVGDSAWLADKERTRDLIRGWKKACAIAGVSWGGGETPTCQGIINPKTIDLAGCAMGIIEKKQQLLTDQNLRAGDRIILLKSTGINANGLSLARRVAKNLPRGYATVLPTGEMYGEALLKKTNIYAQLVPAMLNANLPIHYLTNITGHGLRKLMRGRPVLTYMVERIFPPQSVFAFIQKQTKLSDYEMYQTFNMGQDYAIFLPQKAVKETLQIVKKFGFAGLEAGDVKRGKKQVIIRPKKIRYEGVTLRVR